MATQSVTIEPSEQRPLGALPPTEMTDAQLLSHLQTHLFGPIKKKLRDHLPYLMEARERFAQPGRRVPVKGNPTWTEFCEEQLGVGVRNVQKLLAEGKKPRTEAQKKRKQYDAVDIAHFEKVARAAQQVAEADPNNAEYEPIREAIADKPVLSSPGEAPTKPEPAAKSLQAKLDEQEIQLNHRTAEITELEEQFARIKEENEIAKHHIADNFEKRLSMLTEIPEHLRDENITANLAAEPDRGKDSGMLENYLTTVVNRILPPHIELDTLGFTHMRFAGRDHRIMIGDWLRKQKRCVEDTPITLAKCTGIGECEKRRRVREWDSGVWGKEHVVYNGDESDYTVITEQAARELAPSAFENL